MIDFSTVEGFIFDNDGVIVNSEPLSCGALRQLFLLEFDVDIGDDFSKVIGTSDKYAIHYYMDQHDIPHPGSLDELICKKSDLYFDLAEDKLTTFDGFHDLLQFLQPRYDLAIASSGNHNKIKFSLQQIRASRYFPIICSATEVENGKPAPDLFIFTAGCIGLAEKKCVVIEDSIKGIQGAKAAGMKAIGFTSSFPSADLEDAGADLVVSSFDKLLDMIKYNR